MNKSTTVNPEDLHEKQDKTSDDESIDRALTQMESIYKSRCIQPQGGSNVTVREIEKE